MGDVDRIGSTALRVWRLALYLVWTVALMPIQAVGLLLRCSWTEAFPRFYHHACCRILGLRVRRIGEPIATRPALFVANHVSYLDITVLGSLIAGSFIAKSEVARWPLFGWLARMQRCIFVDRRVGSTAHQRDAIAERLGGNGALILFPEGTSHDGSRILPFKSALFAAAVPRADGPAIAVQPVSVAYTRLDGIPLGRDFRPLFAWYGDMTMGRHLWRMIGIGRLEIVVEFHPPTSFAECGSRKALAAYCAGRVENGLSTALSGRRPRPAEPATRARRQPVPTDLPAAATG